MPCRGDVVQHSAWEKQRATLFTYVLLEDGLTWRLAKKLGLGPIASSLAQVSHTRCHPARAKKVTSVPRGSPVSLEWNCENPLPFGVMLCGAFEV